MSKKIILMCMLAFTMGAPMSANAQAAKAISKGIQAISKAATKGGGKAATKVGTTAGAAAAANETSAVSKAGRTQLPNIKEKSPKRVSNLPKKQEQKRVKTYECPKCNGKGTIRKWDSYLGYYDSTCSSCLGLGVKGQRF